MQIDSEGGAKRQFSGTFDAAKQIFKRGGVSGLYAGITAAWLRQLTYSASRMGIYSYLLENVQQQNNGGNVCSMHRLAARLI
jgi:solute carrier family 25 oxoglutarate transporter 11